ncbi:MAG: hypothetical protein Q7K55_06800 [Candidatus Levybacteria bacterium]|nr:hypothetical protein [Candidatus Levybacteria bacterium]
MDKKSFQKLLNKLSKESGEQKLRMSFDLSNFAKKLRTEGEKYTKNITRKAWKN